MNKGIFIVWLIGLFFVGYGWSQNKNGQDIFVKSWKTGNDQILEQKFDITLTKQNLEFSQIISGLSGNQYKLKIIHIPDKESDTSETGKTTESWRVELRQVNFNKKNEEISSDNLLNSELAGKGGDYFPRDSLIGYIYPKTKSPVTINGEPFIDGQLYYPICKARRIKVENFYVDIQVIDYRLNDIDIHKVDFLRVVIELKNK